MPEHNNTESDESAGVQSPSRRRFVSLAAGAFSTLVAALIGIPLVGMFLGPLFARRELLWIDIGAAADVRKDEPTKFTYSYVKVDGWFEKTVYGAAYVVREKAELLALSNICTHLGCGVRWDPGRKVFACPCHAGVFDMYGRVLSGPPPRPLNRLKTRIANGRIEILMSEV